MRSLFSVYKNKFITFFLNKYRIELNILNLEFLNKICDKSASFYTQQLNIGKSYILTSSRKYEKFLNIRNVKNFSEESQSFQTFSLSDLVFEMKDKCLG